MENPRVIAARREDGKKDGDNVSITFETSPSSSSHHYDSTGILE